MKMNLRSAVPLVLFFCLMVTLDQLTKEWVLSSLRMGHSISVIPGFFDLSLVFNPGAAFGMFADLPEQTRKIALVSVGVIALIIVGRLLIVDARHDRVAQYALAGILSGAVGNIIDRIRFGAVVDFLDVYVGAHHWPAFNVADSAICVGVALLAFRLLPAPAEIPGEGART